ncbi:rhodanese-like domain-containing protein [Uliginosibacterium sp. sgz301328]|uniref:rhodanese-like domain-containing protein n=1 Tax=Uliginosibacterium sp. sgz301328 TaxID=3243764 RepID=UPI00359EDFC6
MTQAINATTVRAWINDGDEIALLDVREAGQFGEGHAFFAVNLPYSRLELTVTERVPRRETRILLIDDGDGIAERAAERLRSLGYTRIAILEGGAAAWTSGGGSLFKGINVPSKTFGELVEAVCGTPHISAASLHRMQGNGDPLLLLDGRTLAEHHKMAVPGALPVPNGELALRAAPLAPDAGVPVVVHCAGRTRSIIGAQTLRHLGWLNPVLALENGTQGWRLAGLELEYGSTRTLAQAPRNVGAARDAARRYARRAGVEELDVPSAQHWLDDRSRTTYVVDVRTAEEYAAHTLPGAVHAPGGQLIQATDLTLVVRGARVLVLDAQSVRAPVAAAWLRQMGWQAATVREGIAAPLKVPGHAAFTPARAPELNVAGLQHAIRKGARLIDVRDSLAYRAGHAAGAAWSIRPRLPGVVTGADEVVLIGEADIAALAAIEVRQAGVQRISHATWNTVLAAGLVLVATPAEPDDQTAIDYLFFVHDRHDGNLDAARRYLEWETGLIGQCTPDELAHFSPLPHVDAGQ